MREGIEMSDCCCVDLAFEKGICERESEEMVFVLFSFYFY